MMDNEVLEAVRNVVKKYTDVGDQEVDAINFNVNSVFRSLKGKYAREDVAKALDQLAYKYSNMYKKWVILNPDDPAQQLVYYHEDQIPEQVKFPFENYGLDVTDDIVEVQYEITL